MVWVNSQFTIEDAIARSQPVWDLLLTRWGDYYAGVPGGTPADEVAIRFPASGTRSLPSPAAIAIGPRSMVDRCQVVWSMQKIVPEGTIWDYTRRLSVGAPLTFMQPANQLPAGITWNSPQAGAVQILTGDQPSDPGGVVDTTNYNITYLKLNGTAGNFGTKATVTTAAGPVAAAFQDPLLHLYFYLQPPAAPPPTKRFPFFYRYNMPGGTVAAGEQLIGMLPIMGRKTVVVQLSPTTITNVRVSVLRAANPVSRAQEETVFTSAAVPASTQVSTTLTNLNADWLLINAVPTAVDDPTVRCVVSAFDD